MKRILSVIIAALMILGAVFYAPQTARAVGGKCGNGVKWDLTNGTLTISGSGRMDDYTANTQTPWYSQGIHTITAIVVKEGVTHIGDHSLEHIANAKQITLPSTLKSIGKYGLSEFHNCASLVLPEGLEEIGEHAFYHSISLQKINIPSTVKRIGTGAFDSTKVISQCDGYLDKVLISSDKTDENGVLRVREGTRLIADGAVHSFTIEAYIPSSVGSIQDGLFKNSMGLATVHFADGITSLGSKLFHSNDYIENIIFEGRSVVIAPDAFEGKNATAFYEPGATFTGKGYGGNITWKLNRTESIKVTASKTDYFTHSVINKRTISIEGTIGDYTYSVDPFDAEVICDTSAEGTAEVKVTYQGVSDIFEVELTDIPDLNEAFEGGDLIRSAGGDRYDTAIATADQLKRLAGIDKYDAFVVASGNNFPDALAGSYLAIVKSAPILLIDKAGKRQTLITDYIRDNIADGGEVFILGGTSSVPASLDGALKKITPNVFRLEGPSRYETNIEILKEAEVIDGGTLLVSNALNFADALSASSLGIPMMLVNGNTGKLKDVQKDYLKTHNFSNVVILGGVNSVPDSIVEDFGEALGRGTKYYRVSGEDRYETSAMIAESFYEQSVYFMCVATGVQFPDGLSGGPLAFAMRAPLLITSEKHYEDAAQYCVDMGVERFVVFGGTASVSAHVINAVRGMEK